MLALSRVMMTAPRLLMIDELALGLAPMTVGTADGDGAAHQRVRHDRDPGGAEPESRPQPGPALLLHERGEIRFDGPTADLMARDDLLRPVFLGTAAAGLS